MITKMKNVKGNRFMAKFFAWKNAVFTAELVQNKIYGIILFLFGLLTMYLTMDGTFCILTTIASLYLFFSTENWIDNSRIYDAEWLDEEEDER